MANEYFYCVSLTISHPTFDPKVITASIQTLRPRIETMVGQERRGKDGKPLSPPRTAAFSYWHADLHPEPRLYSAQIAISDFIMRQLTDLECHRDLFALLVRDGEVTLRIGWFSESNYSADLLGAETLKKCGNLGIGLELNFYAPSQSPEGRPSEGAGESRFRAD
jgi:hypothetical protein